MKRASALLAVSALLSNGLGFARNVVFYWFVPKDQLDIYFASFRVPDFLFNIIIFGAVSSAFVPLASELLSQKKTEEANGLTDQLLSWLTVFFIGAAAVLIILMRPIMHAIAGGFEPARLDQAVLISRILMLQSVFFAWSFTVGGYLNSVKRFAGYAFAPLVYNVAIISGAFLYPRFGLTAMAVAVVIGAFLHFGVQFRELLKTAYRPRLDLRITKHLKDVIRLMIPRSLSQGVSQGVAIVYVALGSTLVSGSIAIFSGMNDIQTMPIQIIGNAMAVAMFPTLSAAIAREDWEAANALLQKTFKSALFILLPAIAFAFVTRAQIVRLYFGIGHDTNWELTTLAIDTFTVFLIGIIPACFVAYLSRVFYATKQTRTPMVLSAIAAVVAVSYATYSIRNGGTVVSLGLAESLVSVVQCILYGYVLWKHADVRLGIRPMLPALMGYLGGAIAVGLSAYAALNLTDMAYTYFGALGTRTVIGLFIQLLMAATVGAVVFVAYSKRVYPEDLAWILKRGFSTKRP